MRWLLSAALIGVMHGQTTLLRLVDSLAIYGKPADALALYDSLLRQSGLSDSLRLRAYLGSLRSLIGLRRWEEIQSRMDTIVRLTRSMGDSLSYAEALSALGEALTRQGKYASADTLLQRAYALLSARDSGSARYGLLLHRMGLLRALERKYEEAEQWARTALSVWVKELGTEHPEYTRTLNNLAVVYREQGRYAEAERLYLEVEEILARVIKTNHPEYARTLNNLANVYYAQGRYAEAERLYLEAKAIRARALGTDHPDYAQTLNNLANVYYAQGRYAEAEKLHLEVKDILARVLGTNHPDYATTLNNLANVYYAQGRYAEAEELHLEVKDIRARVLGTNHFNYARTLNNLASVYYDQQRYAEAERLYLMARDIWAQVFGTNHPDYYFYSLYNVARLYAIESRYTEADPLWEEIISKIFSRLRRDFLTMPTTHRQQLLENLLWSRIQGYQRYVAQRRTTDLIAQGYRVARSVKGLLLSSTEAMRWLVESKKQDTTLQRLYADWRRLSEQYAGFVLREEYAIADSLWEQATEVEKALIQRLPELAAFFPDLEKEPLLPPLKRGEVAVEVFRAFSEKGDSVLYLFYLIEGGKKSVHLHVHRVDTLWERRVSAAYEILRSPGAVLKGKAYQLLWGFIDSLLPRGVKVVYFAPDGIYYRVNVASLYDGQGFVIDRYDVRYVATTRRLLTQRPRLSARQPVVVGNPDFRGGGLEGPEQRVRSYRSFPYGIPPLPGAEAEARSIARLLGTEPVIGAAATEEYIKGVRSPRVLHIATHGYFAGTGKNPMVEGGLLLAQAAVWDSLYPPLGTDDGRLTAQEASTLNLLGTDLVVLSACETGLGEVRGEGLYGLQRAFLEAGASRIITTLWQIDDEATRALMEDFYRRWLTLSREGQRKSLKKSDSGVLVDAAFAQTLRDFRKKYPEPYYWGAFVVMR